MMRASVIPQRMLSTARRVLAAEAAQAQEDSLAQKLSVMPNGLKVATINPDAAGARVMFLVNTGAYSRIRYFQYQYLLRVISTSCFLANYGHYFMYGLGDF